MEREVRRCGHIPPRQPTMQVSCASCKIRLGIGLHAVLLMGQEVRMRSARTARNRTKDAGGASFLWAIEDPVFWSKATGDRHKLQPI